MNQAKKFASLMLALILVFAMTIPAFAASITITSASPAGQGSTETTNYTYYQIFHASIKAGKENIVAYTIPAEKTALKDAIDGLTVDGDKLFTVTLSADGSVYTVLLNKKSDSEAFTGEEIADALNVDNVKNNALTTGTFAQTAPGRDATANNVPAGYYLILSSLGTKLAVQTLNDVTITEKNEYPTNTKEVDTPTASYGQTVTYTVTVTIPQNVAEKEITVVDTITDGLTMDTRDGAIVVTGTKEGAEIADLSWGEGVSVAEGTQYKAVIPAKNVKANAGMMLTLTYRATVNEKAVVKEPEHNKAHIEYDQYTTVDRDTTVTTHGFTVKKIDGTAAAGKADDQKLLLDALDGAEFSLWDAKEGGKKIKVIAGGANGKYRVAQNDAEKENAVPIKAGEATIDGLAAGTYYLQEDKAPTGYNPLTERKAIEVGDATSGEGVDIAVENMAGAVMPSTGGIGTTIFYTVGGILVLAAVVLLITRKRMNTER